MASQTTSQTSLTACCALPTNPCRPSAPPTAAAEDLVFSMPCRSNGDGDYEVITDFVIDDWLRAKLEVRAGLRRSYTRIGLAVDGCQGWVQTVARSNEAGELAPYLPGHLPATTAPACMLSTACLQPGGCVCRSLSRSCRRSATGERLATATNRPGVV